MFQLGGVLDPLPGHEQYEGFLAIPYLGKNDEPWTIRFRCIGNHDCKKMGHGKYRTLSHDQARVFNVRAVHEAERTQAKSIHVTEGELDCIILEQAGLHAVGFPGANQWNPHHARVLAGFERVYVWSDPDPAGNEFADSIMQSLRTAQKVPLRADVNDTYLKGGEAALVEAMESLTWE